MARSIVSARNLGVFSAVGAFTVLLVGACASGGGASTSSGGTGGVTGGSGGQGMDAGMESGAVGGTGGATGGAGGVITGGAGGATGGAGGATGGAGGATGGAGGATGGAGGATGGSAGMAGMAGGSGTAGAAGDAGMAGAAGMAGSTSNGETCNGLDDNANGQIDEGNPGGGQDCSVPNKAGICADGTTECSNGIIQCVQDNQPTSEVCNGLDDNCNGAVDEGDPGANMTCSTGEQGVCAQGTTSCTGGMIVCNPNALPQLEVCNGLDDDCDGTPDDGNPGGGASCNTGLDGICSAGTTECMSGQQQCVQTNQSSAEVCDGLDNDCNGTTDDPGAVNGLTCDTGMDGVCAAGTTQCAAGTPSCNQTTLSSPEACNGLDDDCDGTPDNGPASTLCARFCNLPGGIPNVDTMACTSGACVVAQCPTGRINNDGDVCNGCESTTCVTQPTGTSCGSPNVITPASSPVSGQITTPGGVVWYQVQFQNPGVGNSFNPSITLAAGAANYQMDVLYDACAETQALCPESGGTGSGGGRDSSAWSMDFVYINGCANMGDCSNDSAVPQPLYVKLTRDTPLSGSACDGFTLSVSQ